MYEEITTERLDNFGAIVKEYETLLRHKKELIRRMGVLKAIDYSKDRVQSGNGHKMSEQERYAIALQKINDKIKDYEAWIPPEKEIIKNQIARVRNRDYRKLLILRYVEKWKWAEIVQEFFEFEQDYEEHKKDKYWDTLMYWNRQALKQLEEISTKPYVPVIKQTNIFTISNY